MKLPQTSDTLVLRTDFSDDRAWETVCDAIRTSECEGFVERYACVSDAVWSNFPENRLLEFEVPPYFYLVVDRETMRHTEHPVLAVDLHPNAGLPGAEKRTFRLVPDQATSFACNMNIANMDFSDFADSTDADGIFRGFRSST